MLYYLCEPDGGFPPSGFYYGNYEAGAEYTLYPLAALN